MRRQDVKKLHFYNDFFWKSSDQKKEKKGTENVSFLEKVV